MHNREDPKLKGLFDNLRTEDRERVPEFEAVMARTREEASRSGLETIPSRKVRRPVFKRVVLGSSLLAAAAAAGLLLVQIQHTSDSDFVQVVQGYSADPATGAWKSPTDGLLNLPGKEILSTVPSISTPRWVLNSGASPRRNEL